MKGFLRTGDVILAAILVVLGAGGWVAIRISKSHAQTTSIKIEGCETNLEMALADTVLSIPGPLGSTEIKVRGGKVWITSSPCPRKLCMRRGKISRPGQTLVCLPNQVIITIQGESKMDALTY